MICPGRGLTPSRRSCQTETVSFNRRQTDLFGGQESDPSKSVSFAGLVTRVVFRNEENGYTVMEVTGEGEEIIIVGTMPYLAAGDRVTGEGELNDHPVYGPQIHARLIAREEPQESERIEIYLASGAVKGIGPATAKKLVRAFGDETLAVMRTRPERVARIPGIGMKKAREFSDQLQEDQGYQSLQLLLLPFGIGPSRIHRIHKILGAQAERIIRTNPYELAGKVPGVGFRTADKIASELGMSGDHPGRLRGAVLFTMDQRLFRDGHTVESRAELVRELSRELDVNPTTLTDAVQGLLDEGLLVDAAREDEPPKPAGKWAMALQGLSGEPGQDGREEDKTVSLRDVALIERALARRIRFLAGSDQTDSRFPSVSKARELICDALEREGFEPGVEQEEALLMALTRPFSVLTGGPGTGKTTIVRLLTRILRDRGEDLLLAAPTGRAARRLSEVCRMPAQTLHRLLALQVREDRMPDAAFWLSAEALECDTLIVDECSMIDLFMFAHLLSAVKPGTRVLLIGDADQLPSIGPGQVLRDMLHSDAVPRTRLTEIFRQAQDKLIVSNAHRILKGEPLKLDQSLESDFIFIDCADEQAMHDGVLKLCRDVLPRDYGIDGLYGVQVLTAIRRGTAGVGELNRSLQILAQGRDFDAVEHMGQKISAGDKVMQIRNNYDLEWTLTKSGRQGAGVMNGETGIVESISLSGRRVTVLFEDERRAHITGEDLDDLDLAYAATIHKSQGSEYPVEILVIPSGAPSFLTRNLLYTGVTRARERLFLLTRRRTLSMMLQNNEANERRGMLRRWLNAP